MSLNPKAYTQVSYIINNMSSELKNRIPKEIISMIEKRKDSSYNIDVENIEQYKKTLK